MLRSSFLAFFLSLFFLSSLVAAPDLEKDLQTGLKALSVASTADEKAAAWSLIQQQLDAFFVAKTKPAEELSLQLYSEAFQGKTLAQWRALRSLGSLHGNDSARLSLAICLCRGFYIRNPGGVPTAT